MEQHAVIKNNGEALYVLKWKDFQDIFVIKGRSQFMQKRGETNKYSYKYETPLSG